MTILMNVMLITSLILLSGCNIYGEVLGQVAECKRSITGNLHNGILICRHARIGHGDTLFTRKKVQNINHLHL